MPDKSETLLFHHLCGFFIILQRFSKLKQHEKSII